jgi:hypothetical protein
MTSQGDHCSQSQARRTLRQRLLELDVLCFAVVGARQPNQKAGCSIEHTNSRGSSKFRKQHFIVQSCKSYALKSL